DDGDARDADRVEVGDQDRPPRPAAEEPAEGHGREQGDVADVRHEVEDLLAHAVDRRGTGRGRRGGRGERGDGHPEGAPYLTRFETSARATGTRGVGQGAGASGGPRNSPPWVFSSFSAFTRKMTRPTRSRAYLRPSFPGSPSNILAIVVPDPSPFR